MNQHARIEPASTAPSSLLPATEAEARDRLIVALDVSDIGAAKDLVRRLGDSIIFYKVGLELLFGGGLDDIVRFLTDQGRKIFLDVKVLDVDNTVAKAVENIIHKIDASFVTVHAYRHAIRAAVAARQTADPNRQKKIKILGVTVLTSMDDEDLRAMTGNTNLSVRDIALERAKFANKLGADGVIASGLEAEIIRREIGHDFTIVTPGIRMPGGKTHEQKRVVTPHEALRSGANLIVVGRPITEERDDPKGAAERVIANMIGA